MQSPIIQYTLHIFDLLRSPLPPLFPREAAEDLDETLRPLREREEIALAELEDALIPWGKRLWPYRQAYIDLLDAYEHRLGHRFVRAQLSPALAARYSEFEEHGGSFRDVAHGPPAPFFGTEEREHLREAVIRAWQELRAHAVQGALSVDRGLYERRMAHHAAALRQIERHLEALRELAGEVSDDFPSLAAEIHSYVRGVEHGFCALGPTVSLAAVSSAPEYFLGRKREKHFSPA